VGEQDRLAALLAEALNCGGCDKDAALAARLLAAGVSAPERPLAPTECGCGSLGLCEAHAIISLLLEALEHAAVWLESEAKYPRLNPAPAMQEQANFIRRALRAVPEAVTPGLREAVRAVVDCGPSHDAAYWGLEGHPTITGADCQQMAWARETLRAALEDPR
jgi:hypothetical protein